MKTLLIALGLLAGTFSSCFADVAYSYSVNSYYYPSVVYSNYQYSNNNSNYSGYTAPSIYTNWNVYNSNDIPKNINTSVNASYFKSGDNCYIINEIGPNFGKNSCQTGSISAPNSYEYNGGYWEGGRWHVGGNSLTVCTQFGQCYY